MLFAIDENNIKHEPRPNLHKETPLFCPSCKTSVLSKCGSEKIWHFSHKSTEECDSWSESDPWHLNWQALFPKEQVEIVTGNHRADVISTGGVVIEFQHSYLSSDEAKEREDFYQNMIWLFDAVEPWQDGRLREVNVDNNKNKRIKSFNWEKPKSFIKENYIHYPLLIDIGNNNLIIVLRKSQTNPVFFDGIYISHTNFIRKAASLTIKEAIIEFTDCRFYRLFSDINLDGLTMSEYFKQRHLIIEEWPSIALIRENIKTLKYDLFIYRESVKVNDIRKEINTIKTQLIQIQKIRNNLILESLKDESQKVASIREEIKVIKEYLLDTQKAKEKERQIFLIETEKKVGAIRQQIKGIKDYLVKIQVTEALSKIRNIRRQVGLLKKELIDFQKTDATARENLSKQWLAEWLEKARKERLHKSQAITKIYTQEVDESKLPLNVREEYLKLCSEAQSNGWHISWVIYKCTQQFGKDFEKCVKEQASTVASE